MPFLANGSEVTVNFVGRHESVIVVGPAFSHTRKVLWESPRVEEFRVVIPYLESGFWEVHLTLRDGSRRPLSADHILFRTA